MFPSHSFTVCEELLFCVELRKAGRAYQRKDKPFFFRVNIYAQVAAVAWVPYPLLEEAGA